MNYRPDWDNYFLVIARAVGRRADCTRRQVGCVIVDTDNRIVGTGYNGAPSGRPGCASEGACPRGQLSYEVVPKDSNYDNCIAVHAEANALIWSAYIPKGSTAYITDAPCFSCEKLLAGAGIERIVYP